MMGVLTDKGFDAATPTTAVALSFAMGLNLPQVCLAQHRSTTIAAPNRSATPYETGTV